MNIKKIIASLLAVSVTGVCIPAIRPISSNLFINASALKNYTDTTYGDFDIRKYEDHTEIKKYNGTTAVVKIPSEIEGLIVTAIRPRAFEGNETITSVTIPDTVTNIGEYSFVLCSKLKTINIPKSVTDIGQSAFSGTAWWYDHTKDEKKNKISIIVNNIFVDAGSCTNVVIPDSVVKIAPGAFSGRDTVTSVTIPATLKSIDSKAFSFCRNVKEIIIPNSVKKIDRLAFDNCSNLQSITILNPNCEIYDSSSTICNKNEYDSESKKWVDKYAGMIKGYSGSTAELYAKKYGYTFKAMKPNFLSGDVTMDGMITGSDATCALQAYTLLSSGKDHGLTDIQFKAADVTGDGIITGSDATIILNYYTYLSSVKTGENPLSIEEWMKK